MAVWGSRALEVGALPAGACEPALLSGKLHRGWISDVQLVGGADGAAATTPSSGSGGGGGSLLLLTAGNDGAACLWDLSRAAEAGGGGRGVGGGAGALPQCLARAAGLHAGGIFSLHERAGRVLTASKDGSVVVSSLDCGRGDGGGGGGASLTALQRYDDLHQGGVVKCVRWRDPHTFGSAGNDRRVCVVDARQPPAAGARLRVSGGVLAGRRPCLAASVMNLPGDAPPSPSQHASFACLPSPAGASLAIEGAHATAVNCLRWSPASEHQVLSASHDPALLLHDLRAPGQPLHRFVGHAPGSGRWAWRGGLTRAMPAHLGLWQAAL